MKNFVQLFVQIDRTTKTNEKVDALAAYFNEASDEDKLWTIAIFSGRNPKRIVKTTQLKQWAAESAGIPYWLFEECYHIVGDLSETISSILPDYSSASSLTLAQWIKQMQWHEQVAEEIKKKWIVDAWKQFTKEERFVFNKITSGAFRMGVSTKLMVKALSKHTKLHENKIAHRLMGNWNPYTITYQELLFNEDGADELSKPYPFYLAYAVEGEVHELGDISNWQAEYKWDGIRCQFIQRKQQTFIWSRGEDLITEKFPELMAIGNQLKYDAVIDGELIGYKENAVLNFNHLQTRIGRKNVTAKVLQEVPAVIFAYDLLELDGVDMRQKPLVERRALLAKLVEETNVPQLKLSPVVEADTWEQLIQIRSLAREVNSEGLMLKQQQSIYEVGRKKGSWYKWKLDPMSIDAVMIYAMRGSGRRANMYTDYTFAVWNDNGELVPFAKAYSGLTDKEMAAVDAWIKQHTIDKFGPVRSVTPELVFEIGFEGINYSTRHKSGVALRFPRILRWRQDKKKEEADTLATLKTLIK
ncbi:MAG: ATP-dependent DNA ligase [Bacteroidetes bacterium]|nr:MAG: ATP-dependent DNA ligase [Bacteroidota bacterium]